MAFAAGLQRAAPPCPVTPIMWPAFAAFRATPSVRPRRGSGHGGRNQDPSSPGRDHPSRRDRTIADWRERQGTDWIDQMPLGGMLKAAEFGYRLIFELVDTHDDHMERELRATLAALQPDGVILTPPHSENPQITALLEEMGTAFARIGSLQPGAGLALSMDEEGAAAAATAHLADLGHERIAF